MFDGVLDGMKTTVLGWITDWWSSLTEPVFAGWPLYYSYGVFAAIFIGCVFLAFFLQFKWVRLGLLLIIVAAATWLGGRVSMYETMKAHYDTEIRKKRR